MEFFEGYSLRFGIHGVQIFWIILNNVRAKALLYFGVSATSLLQILKYHTKLLSLAGNDLWACQSRHKILDRERYPELWSMTKKKTCIF